MAQMQLISNSMRCRVIWTRPFPSGHLFGFANLSWRYFDMITLQTLSEKRDPGPALPVGSCGRCDVDATLGHPALLQFSDELVLFCLQFSVIPQIASGFRVEIQRKHVKRMRSHCGHIWKASPICLTFEQNMSHVNALSRSKTWSRDFSCNQHFRRKMAINIIDEGRQMIMRDDKVYWSSWHWIH
jgi:hypothetical protein